MERQDERLSEMKREYHTLHERHSEVCTYFLLSLLFVLDYLVDDFCWIGARLQLGKAQKNVGLHVY